MSNDCRFERAIRAIQRSTLCGADFADWVQTVCDDVVEGNEAECSECGTTVHEGPCVSDSVEAGS
jgi:hypothetical protein